MRVSIPIRPAALALLLLGAPLAARAQCITNSNCIWPLGCGYTGSQGVPLPVPAPPVVVRNLVLIDLPGCTAVPASGTFIVDSFFDVFFELSLDSGQSWFQPTSPTRLLLGTPAPTPARSFTWGEVKSYYR